MHWASIPVIIADFYIVAKCFEVDSVFPRNITSYIEPVVDMVDQKTCGQKLSVRPVCSAICFVESGSTFCKLSHK